MREVLEFDSTFAVDPDVYILGARSATSVIASRCLNGPWVCLPFVC